LYIKFFKLLLVLIFLLEFTACGYKPSARYAREVLGNTISTSIVISAQDPENTVIIKDAVDSAIIEIFHISLVDKNKADTNLNFRITELAYTPLEYNTNGFIISYRATIRLIILRESKNIRKKYVTSGTYDFAVVPNAVLTDKERFDAIKFSAIKAISAFIAQVSAEGLELK